MLRCQRSQAPYYFKRRKIKESEKGHRRQGPHFLGNNTRTLQFLNQLAVTQGALLCVWGPLEDQRGGAASAS